MREFEFGFSRQNINPPMKMGLAGYFNTRIWEKVLDDLEVRVAAFRSGSQQALLIQYDLIACPPEMFQLLKKQLKKAGFGDMVLLVTATHCHTAPEVRRGRGGFEADYLPFAVEQTLKAVRDAVADLTAGTLEQGVGLKFRCSFNRRFWMKDGTVQSNPGKLNPGIIRPEGEIDPEIPLLKFSGAAGKTLLLCSICNHADTTGGNDVSGDWPGWCRRLVEKKLGAGTMVMPLIGCSGDLNHFDVTVPGMQTEPAEAKRIGHAYATAVICGLNSLKPAEPEFSCRSSAFEMPGREIFPDELAEANAVMEKYADLEFSQETARNLTAEDFAAKKPVVLKYFAQTLLERASHPKVFQFEVSLLDFGCGAVIGLPAEPFVACGLTIRKQFCFGKTALIAILNNGSGTGYLPNAWNYGRGGYETTPRSNQFSVHASEIVQHVTALLLKEDTCGTCVSPLRCTLMFGNAMCDHLEGFQAGIKSREKQG